MIVREDGEAAVLLERVVTRALVYARDGRLSGAVLERVLSASGAAHLRDAVRSRLSLRDTQVRDDESPGRHEDRAPENRSRPSVPDGEVPVSPRSPSDTERVISHARLLLESDRRYGASSGRILTAPEEVGLSLIMNGTGQPLPQGAIGMMSGEARAAAHAMVIHNQRLVWSVVRLYNVQGMDAEDLFQHGCTGLLRAVELFDPRQGIKFSTYATHWIRQAITRGIANESRLIRVPVHMYERIAMVRKELRVRQISPRNAPVSEIALVTGLSPDQVAECIRLMSSVASLDEPVYATTEATLGDVVQHSTIPSPENVVVRDSFVDLVIGTLDVLDDRSRKILRMRHGLDELEPMTLDQIGAHFGVTRERIRQLEGKALSRLRFELAERSQAS